MKLKEILYWCGLAIALLIAFSLFRDVTILIARAITCAIHGGDYGVNAVHIILPILFILMLVACVAGSLVFFFINKKKNKENMLPKIFLLAAAGVAVVCVGLYSMITNIVSISNYAKSINDMSGDGYKNIRALYHGYIAGDVFNILLSGIPSLALAACAVLSFILKDKKVKKVEEAPKAE